jgi:hypothetical protein
MVLIIRELVPTDRLVVKRLTFNTRSGSARAEGELRVSKDPRFVPEIAFKKALENSTTPFNED